MRKRVFKSSVLGAVLCLTACPSDPMSTLDMGAGPDLSQPTNVKVLNRASKSTTIAISNDDSLVAMVNPEDGSLSVFTTNNNQLLSKVATGAEPSAVVILPDGVTALVANRAAATVVKVSGINTASPQVSAPVPVGSEPSGLALSPTGAKLFVAEFGESRVSVIDTTSMTVVGSIATNVRNPRGLLVTNNGNTDDTDETLVVPEFFGVPLAEAKDNGRQGRVRLFSVKDLTDQGSITLAALTAAEAGFGVATAPNQLHTAAIAGGKLYFPSVSASPEGPPKFDNNVNPVIYVADLATKLEVKTPVGTTNLAKLINTALPAGMPRQFMAETVDLDFVPQTSIAYAVSRGSDAVVRVDFGGAQTTIGSTQNKQIDLATGGMATGCLNPTGIVVASASQKAYVNCWISRRLGVLDLAAQTLSTTAQSVALPTAVTDKAVHNGKRFFFTGRGRWSSEGWSSCGSCHPDGLTDNITWIFGAGPRQTSSTDGSYSKGAGAQKQRIFNWSAIIDEMHDFEANTRGTSGGKGAITSAPTQAECGDLTKETQVALAAASLGSPPAKELQDQTGAGIVRCVKDHDEIDAYVKTIRPPKARQTLDQASVARGLAVFTAGGCAKCHGGPGFTISNRFYTPSTAQNTSLTTTVTFAKPAAWPASYTVQSTFQIAAQPITAEVAGFNAAPVGPPQVACVIRRVDTFGVPGNVTSTDALEKKPDGTRAQGRGGYNVPSLYGIQVGAPFLHHGQAKTLDELFTDANWMSHTQAGAANFLIGATAAQDRADLINYLLSIDASTAEQAVPAGFGDGCKAM